MKPYFKIKYMLAGRYPSTLIGRILSWENGGLRVIDINMREYNLKEDSIKSITQHITQTKSAKNNNHSQDSIQDTLF